MNEIRINSVNIDYIYVHDNLAAPVTGLVQADFGIEVSVDGVTAVKTVVITEVDATDRPGLYKVKFTPDVLGMWWIQIKHAVYEPIGFAGYYRVQTQITDDINIENLGPGNRLVTVTVRDDVTQAPVIAAYVELYDPTLATKIAFAYTNSNGQILFTLYDGAYKAIISKIGQYVFTVPDDLIVSGDTQVTYEGTLFSPSTPTSPGVCVVYGWEYDESSNPKIGTVKAQIVGAKRFLVSNPHIIRGPVSTKSRISDGYWELPLTRSDQYEGSDITYKFTIDDVPLGDFEIPAQASIALKDLVTG